MTIGDGKFRSPLSPLGVVAVACCLWISSIAAVTAQDVDATVSSHDRIAMAELLGQMQGHPSRVEMALRQVGFSEQSLPPDARVTFRNWPDVRKLEYAYRSAVAAGGSAEGTSLLRAVARYIAAHWSNAIRSETHLSHYFPEPRSQPIDIANVRIRFSSTIAQDVAVPLEISSVVKTITKYTAVTPGGIIAVMSACCRLPESASYRMLTESSDNSNALLRAIVHSPAPPRPSEKLNAAIQHVLERNSAFALEPTLKLSNRKLLDQVSANFSRVAAEGSGAATSANAFGSVSPSGGAVGEMAAAALQAQSLTVRDGRVVRAAGGSAVGTLSGQTSFAEANKQQFDRIAREASESQSGGAGGANPHQGSPRPKFGPTVRVSRGGFGGVVFGNTISDPANRSVRSVSWIRQTEYGGRNYGRYEFEFDDGTFATSALLPDDVARAAYDVVYNGVAKGGTPVDSTDDAIPLAGIDERVGVTGLSFDEESNTISLFVARRFIVNPAIAGSRLAHSAVLADAYPFMLSADVVKRRVRRLEGAERLTDVVDRFFSRRKGNYKITDVTAEIEIGSDGYIDVIRTGDAYESDRSLRTSALISMVAFDDNGKCGGKCPVIDEDVIGFYRLVPVLAAAFEPFRDLNDFAEALYLTRWAKFQSAVWRTQPSRVAPVSGRDAVIAHDDEVSLATWGAVIELGRSELRELNTALLKMSQGVPRATELSNELASARNEVFASAGAFLELSVLEIATSPEVRKSVSASAKEILIKSEVSYERLTNLSAELTAGDGPGFLKANELAAFLRGRDGTLNDADEQLLLSAEADGGRHTKHRVWIALQIEASEIVAAQLDKYYLQLLRVLIDTN
jgi:hypothetical protein